MFFFVGYSNNTLIWDVQARGKGENLPVKRWWSITDRKLLSLIPEYRIKSISVYVKGCYLIIIKAL